MSGVLVLVSAAVLAALSLILWPAPAGLVCAAGALVVLAAGSRAFARGFREQWERRPWKARNARVRGERRPR